MRKRFLSLCLIFTLCFSLLTCFSVSGYGSENLLTDGSMSTAKSTGYWTPDEGQTSVTWNPEGYIEVSGRVKNYNGVYIDLGSELDGKYEVTVRLRVKDSGMRQQMRVGQRTPHLAVQVTDQWETYRYTLTATKGKATVFQVAGGYSATEDIKDFCIDDVVITPLDGAVTKTFSPRVAEAYIVDGPNLLQESSFDSDKALRLWGTNGTVTYTGGGTGVKGSEGYLTFSDISPNWMPFSYDMGTKLAPGMYQFVGYFRTAHKGSVSQIRVSFSNGGTNVTTFTVNLTDEWQEVIYYLTVQDGQNIDTITTWGGPYAEFIQPYCVDNFSLVSITEEDIPAKVYTVFGTNVTPAEAKASWSDKNRGVYDPEKEAQYKVDGLMINQDGDGFIGSCADGTATVDSLKNYAYQFKDSHITDYMICVNNTNASYPSEVWTDVVDKYHQTEENGKAVNYKDDIIMKGAHHIYETLGTDYIYLWTEAFKEIGINPWLSFRMNDLHDVNLETSRLLSEFFHEHVEVRRVQHHNPPGYGDQARDYGQELARDYMLALIDEALGRYDTYGIELDFMRSLYYFQIGREYEGIEVMNQFLRDVDALVSKHEEKRGHDIAVAVRVASDIQVNLDMGLNVMQWAVEDLIDMVIPTGAWVTDNDMPIELWATLLAPYENVTLAAGLEANLDSEITFGQTLETLAGSAANYYSQGADKIYLFNLFRAHGGGNVIEDSEKVYVKSTSNMSSDAGYWNMITLLGSKEKVMQYNRRLVMTYRDTTPYWRANDTRQLNKTVSPGAITYLRTPVGDIPEGSKVLFKFAVSVDKIKSNFLTVYVNSELCEFSHTEIAKGGYTNDLLYCYTVPEEAWSGYLLAEITTKVQTFGIDYVEVTVTPPEGK